MMDLSNLQKKILELMSDGKFHSGNEIAKKLRTNRSNVWGQIKGLSSIGLDVSAVRGQGYRFQSSLELLDQETIKSGLSNNGRENLSDLEIYQEIGSTNSYLMENAANLDNGAVCLAEFQSAGRGRSGRAWISPFAANINFSVLWHYQKGASSIGGLSLAMGVAILRALRVYCITGLGLKWPNDVLYHDQKLAGILIEVSGDSHGPCNVVTGVGLNWHMPDHICHSIDQKWTDMKKVLGSGYPKRNHLVSRLLNEILPILASYDKTSLTPYLEEWRGSDCMINKNASLYWGDRRIYGRVQGIDNDGMIILQTENGKIQRYASGEVSFKYEIP